MSRSQGPEFSGARAVTPSGGENGSSAFLSCLWRGAEEGRAINPAVPAIPCPSRSPFQRPFVFGMSRRRSSPPRQTSPSGTIRLVGQPGLGLVRPEHPLLRIPGPGAGRDLLLPLGSPHQAPRLRISRNGIHLHRVHRPALLVRELWRDQLSPGAPGIRDPLAQKPTHHRGFRPVLVRNPRG